MGGGSGAQPPRKFLVLKTTPFALARYVNNTFLHQIGIGKVWKGSNYCDYLLSFNELFKQGNKERMCVTCNN